MWKELSRITSAEWRSMSPEDKKIYQDEAVKERQNYTKEIQNWECDIIKKGYAHLLPKHKFFDLRPTNRDNRYVSNYFFHVFWFSNLVSEDCDYVLN